VRALVRPTSAHGHLIDPRVELCHGDLRDGASLQAACEGIDAVISTATVVFPRGPASFDVDEAYGYRNLVAACAAAGVRQLLFVSIAMPFSQPYVEAVPTLRLKYHCEELIRRSATPHTIVRCTPFMDDYFALMGSAIPLLGEDAATLHRLGGVLGALRRFAGRSVESVGVALAPGPVANRHAFVAVRDVAALLLSAVGRVEALGRTLVFGGPEAVSWAQVAALYAELLHRPVRALPSPPWLYRTLSAALRIGSESISNQLGLLWVLSENSSDFDTSEIARTFGVERLSPRSYLASKVEAMATAQRPRQPERPVDALWS
jgi:uncharacterized protein YbjT (DUF2867 family)